MVCNGCLAISSGGCLRLHGMPMMIVESFINWAMMAII
jgi:hypothetical protein